MAILSNKSFDTNLHHNTTTELALTTETVITLYVNNKTGSHQNSRMCLEYSPDDGVTWLTDRHQTNGIGFLTSVIAATKVRAKVCNTEGSAATADVFIVAR